MIELEDLIRLFERSAKAMEDAAHFARVRPHDVERVLPGVPLMNDHVQSQFDCEIELLFKQTRLFRFVSAVVDFRLEQILGGSLERFRKNLGALLSFRQFQTWQRMIIQARFAERDHARVRGKFAEWRDHIFA